MVDVDPEPDMVIVTPDAPEPFKVTRPEMMKVGKGVDVATKSCPMTFALFTAIALFEGLKVYPAIEGVTEYDPFWAPVKV